MSYNYRDFTNIYPVYSNHITLRDADASHVLLTDLT